MELYIRAKTEQGLTRDEIADALSRALAGQQPRHVLIVPPDITRLHSNAGLITNLCYHMLTGRGAQVDILPALGTHVAMTREEASAMFGDVPFERFVIHNWRTDVVRLGEIPAAFLHEVSDGLWNEPIEAEINRLVMDPKYDLILSPGQVVPHEVVGMANHAKNLLVGVGGSRIINHSHMLGAVYGMERMMGRDHSPVRKAFDYAFERFLSDRPILFLLTVCTAPGGNIRTHGLFIGRERAVFEAAVALSVEKNIDFVDRGFQKCVVFLDPAEFRTTWLGNKAIYRTRMAMADGGDLIVLASGVTRFGEDAQVDALIRKYGYGGRARVLAQFNDPENTDLRANMGAAAHLIHGSSDGRFRITYAVKAISQEEIASVGFLPADYGELAARYDPARLQPGYNTLPDGEELFFIPNPALGLWAARGRFDGEGRE